MARRFGDRYPRRRLHFHYKSRRRPGCARLSPDLNPGIAIRKGIDSLGIQANPAPARTLHGCLELFVMLESSIRIKIEHHNIYRCRFQESLNSGRASSNVFRISVENEE